METDNRYITDISCIVKSRLQIYKQNVEAILSTYSDLLKKIDGNRPKDVVFGEINSMLLQIQKEKETKKSGKFTLTSKYIIKNAIKLNSQFNKSPATKENWRGIPTNLNNIPHSREIREYFYDDVLQATQRAISDGKTRVKVEINIPELNPEQDVYRIGTLMELVRVLALSFADDGKRVKVCLFSTCNYY
ncbi:putative adenylate kinase [Helianthus anomalus]